MDAEDRGSLHQWKSLNPSTVDSLQPIGHNEKQLGSKLERFLHAHSSALV